MALTPVAQLFRYGRAFVKLFAKKDRDTWSPISFVRLRFALRYGL
jgi:hypothetical protein